MLGAQAKTQPRPEIISEGPIPAEVNVEVNVDSSERSASVARARPKDQVTKKAKAKRAGSASTSQRSPSPKRDYPRGISAMLKVPDGTFSWKWFKSLAQRSDLNLVRSTWSPK